MRLKIFASIAVLTTISLSAPAQAENLKHLNQLLATKQCPNCELMGTGLVMLNLSGANLKGANLTQANLSRANLAGADLSGANLTGTSLHGANLTGANLTGANLTGTDLRSAYLFNANLTDTSLENAYVEGTMGIPARAATAEQFHKWGLAEARQSNFPAALENFDRAITVDSKYAPAYLARALTFYRLGNEPKANKDARKAAELFKAQKNESGYVASTNFMENMELARKNAEENKKGEGMDIGKIFSSVASLALQFLF
ncbi:MAG: pentapeptide repeat-containing protein [Prochloraceae cyanobacterium]